MAEPNQKQLLANALSVLAVLLTASGILVSNLPLESKRPAGSEQARITPAARQDVEARLWQDPFAVTQRGVAETRKLRCKAAKADRAHHPITLSNLIRRRVKHEAVTVLPVMVPGGPYFENGESRRRARYAVVTALLHSGWEPVDEEKIGYIWTFESCIDDPWLGGAPEMLPWEWYHRRSPEGREGVLVLWVDDDVISNRPLRGVNEIVKSLELGGLLCSPSKPAREAEGREEKREKTLADVRDEKREKALADVKASLLKEKKREKAWADLEARLLLEASLLKEKKREKALADLGRVSVKRKMERMENCARRKNRQSLAAIRQ